MPTKTEDPATKNARLYRMIRGLRDSGTREADAKYIFAGCYANNPIDHIPPLTVPEMLELVTDIYRCRP